MCNGWWDNINKHVLFSTPRAVGKNKLYFMIWAGCGGCTGFSFAFVRNFLRTVWYMISYISYALWVLYLEFQTIPMYVRSISFGWMTFGFYLFLKNGPAFCLLFVKELLVWDWFDSRIKILALIPMQLKELVGTIESKTIGFLKLFEQCFQL